MAILLHFIIFVHADGKTLSFSYSKNGLNPNESSGYSSGSLLQEQPYSSEEQLDTPPTLPIQNGMGVGNGDIEHSFGTLVVETCRSFKQRKEVSIDEIVLLLEQLSIFGNSMEVIHKAEKMKKLFQSFRDKWSWYNHSLLEDLINDFGDDQDKERFREYHSKFTSFLKSTLPRSQNELALVLHVEKVRSCCALKSIRTGTQQL